MTTNFMLMTDAHATKVGQLLGIDEDAAKTILGQAKTFQDVLTEGEVNMNIGSVGNLLVENLPDTFVDGARFVQGTAPNSKQTGADQLSAAQEQQQETALLQPLDNTFSPPTQGLGKPGATQGKFSISYNDLENNQKKWHFILLPAIESHLRMSSGAPVVSGQGQQPPEVKAGIMVKTTMKHKNIVVPGSSNVVQTIGIESTVIQLCGAFIGVEGNSEAGRNLGNQLLYPPWGKQRYVIDNGARHSWVLAREFDVEVVQPGRAVTSRITTQLSELDAGKAITMEYTGVVVGFKIYAVRKDRTFYCLDILVTQSDITKKWEQLRTVEQTEAEEFGEGEDKNKDQNGNSGNRDDEKIQECQIGEGSAANAGGKLRGCLSGLFGVQNATAQGLVDAAYDADSEALDSQAKDFVENLIAERQREGGEPFSPEEVRELETEVKHEAELLAATHKDQIEERRDNPRVSTRVGDGNEQSARAQLQAELKRRSNNFTEILDPNFESRKAGNAMTDYIKNVGNTDAVGVLGDFHDTYNNPASTNAQRQAAAEQVVRALSADSSTPLSASSSNIRGFAVNDAARILKERTENEIYNNIDYGPL